jgi:hypothetical protein
MDEVQIFFCRRYDGNLQSNNTLSLGYSVQYSFENLPVLRLILFEWFYTLEILHTCSDFHRLSMGGLYWPNPLQPILRNYAGHFDAVYFYIMK